MRIRNLANQRIIVARMTAVAGTAHRKVLATVTAEYGNVQPLDPQKAAAYDGVATKKFVVYTEADVDIDEGDQLRDEYSREFRVVAGGISRHTQGALDYLEIIVEQTN
jgi:hypothetical protein